MGVVDGEVCLDLPYVEDSTAEVDLNVVMTSSGKFVEVQGTAEDGPFERKSLEEMLDAAEIGIKEITEAQRNLLSSTTSRSCFHQTCIESVLHKIF